MDEWTDRPTNRQMTVGRMETFTDRWIKRRVRKRTGKRNNARMDDRTDKRTYTSVQNERRWVG